MKLGWTPAFLRNSPNLATWVALTARIGGGVLVIPMALHYLPAAVFALWMLFMTVASLQQLADFGFSQTFSRFVSYAVAGVSLVSPGEKQDPRLGVARAHKAMGIVYRTLSLISLVLLLTLGSWAVRAPIEHAEVGAMGWGIWIILAASTALALYGNRYVAYLIGTNRIAEQKLWEALFATLVVIAQVLVLHSGASLLGLVVVSQVGVLLQVAVNRYLVRLDQRIALPDTEGYTDILAVRRAAWHSAWRSALGIGFGFATMQIAVVIIVNDMMGPEAATFLFGLRLMQLISQLSQVPFYTKLPALAGLRAQGQVVQLERSAARNMRISLLLFVAGFALVAGFGQSALEFVRSQTEFPSTKFWVILGLGVLLERFGAMHLQLHSTTNTVAWHKANGVFSLLFVPLLVLGLPMFGSLAYPLALLTANMLAYAPYSALHSYRTLALPVWEFEKKSSVLPALLMLIICILFVIHHD